MTTQRWIRLSALTGVVFAVLVAVSFVTSGNSPDVKATGAEVIKYYRDHRTQQQISDLLGALGSVFFVFWAAVQRTHLRNTGVEALAALSFGGAIMVAVGGATFSSLGFALADSPDKLDPAAAQALNVLTNDFFFVFATGVAVFMVASWLATIRGRGFPLWLGWVALVIGVAAVTPLGLIGVVGLLAWVLVASILLYVRGGPRQRTAS